MNIKTIASGSKGNCTIASFGKTHMIIDLGISYLTLKKSLEGNSLSLSDFSGILITHSHTDHIKGLASVVKHTDLPVYIPMDMYPELKHVVPLDRCTFIEDTHQFNDVELELIHTSHDTASSVGYIFYYQNKKMIYVTDTGYINRKYLKKMDNADVYIIESNHDIEMLMDGPYPEFLKRRVVGDSGHLSNCTTAKYLDKLVGENTKYIVLAHLSEKNNTEELAYQETAQYLQDKDVQILIAKQNEEGPLLEV